MPSGVFKPYAGVSTAILIFTKTESGGTDHVWFYHMQADGLSLDDKRTLLTPKQGESEHSVNNLPDILARWRSLTDASADGETGRDVELNRERTEQSFLVPKAEIAENDYDLSINRYKEIVYEEVEYDPPAKILGELRALESQIETGLDELEALLER
ncbi:Type I restriction-modification system, DNA-methyltransferase subunit M [Salinisphaera sp. LB1]|nr:N-6 DNA methylase [Salinisphaera sp. LB1]AWN14243.1 Type I restriction-modification system, DNA-methyltransferase subunit M [Salinisphaera sp. LB1]